MGVGAVVGGLIGIAGQAMAGEEKKKGSERSYGEGAGIIAEAGKG